MEKEFKKFQAGLTIKANNIDWTEQKMLNNGVLIASNGLIMINPIVERCKSYTKAKMRIKSMVDSWLTSMQKEENSQLKFREEQVEYFKNNPVGELYTRGSVMYADFPKETPEEYKNGKGFCYLFNGNVVSMHFGFKEPKNAPKGCDRFSFNTSLDSIVITG
jgi:hypothetical protein